MAMPVVPMTSPTAISRLSTCTSVAVIAELVAGGVGAGLLPILMAQRFLALGQVQLVASNSPVENGRLFICYRTGLNDPKVAAVAQSIAQVMRRIDYVDL